MERLDGSVRRALRSSGVPDAGVLAQVTRAWPEAVGPAIARSAWPQRLARDGTLHVTTVSSTWAFELGRMEAEIRAKLAASLGDATPHALRFAPGPVPSPPAAEEERPPAPVPDHGGGRESRFADGRNRGSGAPRGGAPSRRRKPCERPRRPFCLIYLGRPAKPLFCRHFLIQEGHDRYRLHR